MNCWQDTWFSSFFAWNLSIGIFPRVKPTEMWKPPWFPNVSHSEIFFHGGFSTSFGMLTGVHPQFLRVPPPIFFSMFIPSSIHMKQPHSMCFYTLLFIMVSGSGLQNSSTMNVGRDSSKAIMHHQYFNGFNLLFYSPKYHLCLYHYQQCHYLISIPSSIII